MDIIDFTCRNSKQKSKARELLFISQNGMCFYCGIKCSQSKTADTVDERNRWFVLDHKIAVAKGGNSLFSNLIGSCYLCNQNKRDKDFDFKNHVLT